VRLDRDNLRAHYELAVTYWKLGEKKKARGEMEQVVRRRPVRALDGALKVKAGRRSGCSAADRSAGAAGPSTLAYGRRFGYSGPRWIANPSTDRWPRRSPLHRLLVHRKRLPRHRVGVQRVAVHGAHERPGGCRGGPELGGRIVQLRLDGFEYLWVNPALAGQVRSPDPAEEARWPAGRTTVATSCGRHPRMVGPDEWPGPPDPWDRGGRTDSGRFDIEVLAAGPDLAAVRLTGPKDLYAGIRFVREIRLYPRTTTVDLVSTMENVVDRPVRWGICR